jgi:hypothetical protein
LGAILTRYGFAILAIGILTSTAAQSGVFEVPDGNPKFDISVPDRWSPNDSDSGVDVAAPDNSTFFSIYTMETDSVAAVQRDSLAVLTRNGIKIEKSQIAEHPVSFGGLNWVEDEYAATEDGKPRLVKLDASHLSGKIYVQLFIWGTPDGLKKNAASIGKILSTIKLKKH